MSLQHPFPPPFETLAPDPPRSTYPGPYHAPGPAPRTFAGGSSLNADHLEHPQCPPPFFHARGAPSTGTPRYTGTSSATAPPRYATGVPISEYGAPPGRFRPAGRTWDLDALPASADDVQGLAVHGHASEGLLALRYSAAAAGSSRSAPSPVVPCDSSYASGSGFKSALGEGVVLASPTPVQPQHSSDMAILLSGGDLQQHDEDAYGDSARSRAFDHLRMPVSYALVNPDVCAPPLDDDPDALEEGYLSREKKHGCTMCHKRFDRPSTLKKHLLVHTGEKAFQCTICERRFGVMSNLNRHIRRCSLREVHTHGAAGSAPAHPSSLEDKDDAPPATVTGKRGRTPPPGETPDPAKAPRKRRRRPPSPSRWIPASLRAFNLLAPELTPAADVPLPPVRPTYLCPDTGRELGPQWEEERDSFDENVGRAPYHPSDWDKTCRLPGPAGIVKFGGGISGNYIGDSGFGYELYRGRSGAIRVG